MHVVVVVVLVDGGGGVAVVRVVVVGVVVVVGGGGGGVGGDAVVGAGDGGVMEGEGAVEEGVSVVGVAAGATTSAVDGVAADVERWVAWDWVWWCAVVVVLGALGAVEGGAAVGDAVGGGIVGAGGAVETVCSFTTWPAAVAGRFGLFECGVRTKAIPRMAAMTPRPAHMPHWRVGERSAVTGAAAGSG